jgi:hypothetical protein
MISNGIEYQNIVYVNEGIRKIIDILNGQNYEETFSDIFYQNYR